MLCCGAKVTKQVAPSSVNEDNGAPQQKKAQQKKPALKKNDPVKTRGWGVGAASGVTAEPGSCQFGNEWTKVKLKEKTELTPDTLLLTFGLPESRKPLGLSTCACIQVKTVDDESSFFVRPYTPVSTNALVGAFSLVVKVYEGGKVGEALKALEPGGEVCCKHQEKNVKRQYPFDVDNLILIGGGTGITPLMQVLHAVLGNPDDAVKKVTLVYGNKTASDIIGKDVLDHWAQIYKDKFDVVYALSKDACDGIHDGQIDLDLLREHLPEPDDDESCLAMVCGPPGLYETVCGPRHDSDVGGALKDLNFTSEQVYKF